MRYKVGIYTRVSTDEQALRSEGSLETQKHRIIAEIENRNRRDGAWGKTVDFYEDDGYSAAEYRPAYERLMSDVRKGKVNMVFVADYFRFCRHLLDYLQLAEQFKEIGAKILSVKDNFDTETAMGQSMIRNYINMAQTERELTAERVSTNFHARALRGLRNGGRVLHGFDRNDKDLARLTINEKEAAEIREIFQVFLEEATCPKSVERLNKTGPLRKTKSYKAEGLVKIEPWTRSALQYFLRNPTYAGLREINKRSRGKDQESLREFSRHQTVKASWPAIVDDVTWNTVQECLDFAQTKARAKLTTKERRDYLLTGLLRCSECGERLMGASGHGTKSVHRYYVHRPVKGKKIACSMNWIPADELERPVIERLGLVLEDEGYLDRIEGKIENLSERRRKDLAIERTEIEAVLARSEIDIKKLIRLQTQCDDPTVDEAFRDQLRSLSDEKRTAKVRFDEIGNQMADLIESKVAREAIKINVEIFKKAYAKSQGTVRKRLLGFVFEALTFGDCELKLFYSPTAVSALAVHTIQSSKSSEKNSGDSPNPKNILQFRKPVRRTSVLGPHPSIHRDQKVFLQAIGGNGRPTRIR